jgi:predicted transcriptional regulator
MKKTHILTFRVDDHLRSRIAGALGSRYRTRTGFIRAAIDQLLDREARTKSVIPVIQF